MPEIQMGMGESRFADIVWAHEPVTSSELVKLGASELGWKRTTVHTVLRRLCDKGLFRNDGGTVTAVISRAEFYSMRSQKVVEESFGGSLPAFIAAFTSTQTLTGEERTEILRMIENAKED